MKVLKITWDFFQNEVLGMGWLNRLISTILNACGLDTASRVGGSVLFFIYDTIKIMILLGILVLIISYIQSYFPPERTKRILGRYHGIWANLIAALLGTVTPFCSCSSIPLFIGFTSAGLPLGVTFSFLISSPMVDLGSFALLMSIFGWKVAFLYVVLGLVIAVAGGTLIEKLHLENQVEEYIRKGHAIDVPQEELHFKVRLKYAWEQVVATAKKVTPYVLIGVGIGAIIHNWIPQDFIVRTLGDNNPFGPAEPGPHKSRRRVFWRCICNYRRCSDVCGYFRHNPYCGSFACKGCFARRCSIFYDGCDHSFSSLNDYASQGSPAKAAGHFHCNMYSRYYRCRLFLQRSTIFNCLVLGGYHYGII